MVIRSFQDDEVKTFFNQGIAPRRKGWGSVGKIVKRKLDMLDYAADLKDLLSPPSNRLESLAGDLKGFYSIRINDQSRIIFRWDKQPFDVRIMDYH
jgi:toxin HigB-1